jgi:uncharacterized protein YecE (DUF72 family)
MSDKTIIEKDLPQAMKVWKEEYAKEIKDLPKRIKEIRKWRNRLVIYFVNNARIASPEAHDQLLKEIMSLEDFLAKHRTTEVY